MNKVKRSLLESVAGRPGRYRPMAQPDQFPSNYRATLSGEMYDSMDMNSMFFHVIVDVVQFVWANWL